ncbi:mitochondrial import receptor subunit tom20 [Cytospora paraplurivora]|uniref:Mitochondrial import receptor subunit tom20 n=1 Tax=Cytospora paraplurivora TaxID=2898453 RepID=A0AAN9UJJ1_9PEZI
MADCNSSCGGHRPSRYEHALAGQPAYAVYFDHARRSKPEFRRQLRRNDKQQARRAKEHAEAETQNKRQTIKQVVDEAKEEGFPTSVEEKEAYFLDQVTIGEQLGTDREYRTRKANRGSMKKTGSELLTWDGDIASRTLEAALAFYKGLKVYPTPGDLINIYDKTVPKPILDILAEMIAYDGSLRIEALSGGIPGMPNLGNISDIPNVGLD